VGNLGNWKNGKIKSLLYLKKKRNPQETYNSDIHHPLAPHETTRYTVPRTPDAHRQLKWSKTSVKWDGKIPSGI
jgi:hypothetical protein